MSIWPPAIRRINRTFHHTGASTMKFMTIVSGPELNVPPPPEMFDAIAKLGEETVKAGIFVDQGGLHPTALGTKIRISKGKMSVTDGPFTEAKEVIGGWAIFDVASKEEMLKWARRFMDVHVKYWPEWEGVVEVRQVVEGSERP
jgi:hypothetical protein